jgi:hypothetical protein
MLVLFNHAGINLFGFNNRDIGDFEVFYVVNFIGSANCTLRNFFILNLMNEIIKSIFIELFGVLHVLSGKQVFVMNFKQYKL